MAWTEWYDNLINSSWPPAPSTIGFVWSILYPVIVVSFGFVFAQTLRGKVPWMVALPSSIDGVANILFMPVFSRLRNPPLESVDII
jgi:benzodiazapine receptor